VYVPLRPPDPVVMYVWLSVGAVQPTDTLALTRPPRATVGSLGSLLHSRMLPIEVAVYPLPLIVTFVVPVALSPVSGVTLKVPVFPGKVVVVVVAEAADVTPMTNAAVPSTINEAAPVAIQRW
jgi:hypothetical protein